MGEQATFQGAFLRLREETREASALRGPETRLK